MIEVRSPGFLTTIQDKGRYGYRSLGVPISGVMDSYSAAMANMLLDNEDNMAVLEINMMGPSLLFTAATVIAITGADLSAKCNEDLVKHQHAIAVEKGDVLSFGEPKYGLRCYLAVKGGICIKKVLGSRSYYRGITEAFRLLKGDLLPHEPLGLQYRPQYGSLKISEDHFRSPVMEVTPGPEFGLLSPEERDELLGRTFTISKAYSRMGYQLNESLKHTLPQMITSPVLPGTVQLTPSGKPIVLMRDCQTTGGYPRVLQLTESAMSRLSQKRAGKHITFKFINY